MDKLSPPDQPRANVRVLRSTAQASRRGRNWLHALCTCPRVLNCRPQQQFAGPAASSVCCQLVVITVSRAAAPCRQNMLLMLRHAETMHSRPKLGVRRSCGRGLTLCTFVDADTIVSVSAMPLTRDTAPCGQRTSRQAHSCMKPTSAAFNDVALRCATTCESDSGKYVSLLRSEWRATHS